MQITDWQSQKWILVVLWLIAIEGIIFYVGLILNKLVYILYTLRKCRLSDFILHTHYYLSIYFTYALLLVCYLLQGAVSPAIVSNTPVHSSSTKNVCWMWWIFKAYRRTFFKQSWHSKRPHSILCLLYFQNIQLSPTIHNL